MRDFQYAVKSILANILSGLMTENPTASVSRVIVVPNYQYR